MYENAFNAIEKDLRAEEGISNELDYVEQISWVLFLKYLHDLEAERRDRAELNGELHTLWVYKIFDILNKVPAVIKRDISVRT